MHGVYVKAWRHLLEISHPREECAVPPRSREVDTPAKARVVKNKKGPARIRWVSLRRSCALQLRRYNNRVWADNNALRALKTAQKGGKETVCQGGEWSSRPFNEQEVQNRTASAFPIRIPVP